jgi:hypothetical protein
MEINQIRDDDTASDWLVWPGTIRLVSVAAVWSSCVLLLLFSVRLFPNLPVWNAAQHVLVFRIVFGVGGAGGAIALQFLLVAMIWYWVKLDHSPQSQKTWWFLSFFVCFVGIPIYAWMVYRKQIIAATLAQS